jgi:hypothetical protein
MQLEELLSDFDLNFRTVKKNYKYRKNTHKNLVKSLKRKEYDKYVLLAVGIQDDAGNFSASEHHLGEPILAHNSTDNIIELANNFYSKEYKASELPELIYKKAQLPYLKISIGTEMAMMLRPKKYWVGNVRTIWSHLVIKHNGDIDRANEELELYRDNEESSEMYYLKWQEIYRVMNSNLNTIEEISLKLAKKQKIKPGKIKYLWIDAVCNEMYSYINE